MLKARYTMDSYFDQASKAWDQNQYRHLRAQVVAQQIYQVLSSKQPKRILDFGCGTGLLGMHFLKASQQVVFADTSSGMLEEVQKKILASPGMRGKTLLLGPEKLEETFDLVVSLMALHHIEDWKKSVRELAQVLEPGGILALCDLDTENGDFHKPEIVPHQGFSRLEISDQLNLLGLEVFEVSTVFVNKKTVDGKEKDFPVFLIAARKAPEAL